MTHSYQCKHLHRLGTRGSAMFFFRAQAFVDNVGRRTWDKEEYEKRAKDRLEEEEAGGKREYCSTFDLVGFVNMTIGSVLAARVQAEVVLRAPLKARETLVDLTKRLGKSQVRRMCLLNAGLLS